MIDRVVGIGRQGPADRAEEIIRERVRQRIDERRREREDQEEANLRRAEAARRLRLAPDQWLIGRLVDTRA